MALIKRSLLVEEDLEAGYESRGDGFRNSAPPPWIDELEDIRYNCSLISTKMKEVDALQNKHLQRPTFDDDTSTEMQIEDLTQSITHVSIKIKYLFGYE